MPNDLAPPPFQAMNFQHVVVLVIIVLICVLIAWKAREGRVRKWLGALIGLLLIAYAAVLYLQQAINRTLAWEYSLPLELCNLVLIACILSLFRPSQFGSELAYYWGLGGVLQATLTPDLSLGFPSWDFIFFFWGHGVTLMAIIFLVANRGFRPRPRSILRMMIALNVYGLLVGILDAVAGWNYGYLCKKPAGASLFDILGPWPWYLLSVEGIAIVTFAILDIPWRLSAKMSLRNKPVMPPHS